jgi:hypothetical protein
VTAASIRGRSTGGGVITSVCQVLLCGSRLVVSSTRAPAVLLHLRLEEVPLAAREGITYVLLTSAELGPIGVVVVLDDLERPAALDHVAADELGLEHVGMVVVAGLAQQVDRLAEGQVGGSGQAVEAVEQTSGVLHDLERLGELAERGDRRVVDAVGSEVGVVGGLVVAHGPTEHRRPVGQQGGGGTAAGRDEVRALPGGPARVGACDI